MIAALSGHPRRAEAVHRSAAAGLATLAAGLVLLLFTGGRSGGSLPIALIATSAGMCLLCGRW